MEYIERKNFRGWIKLKARLHFGGSAPKIYDGDIWRCGCGENIKIGFRYR